MNKERTTFFNVFITVAQKDTIDTPLPGALVIAISVIRMFLKHAHSVTVNSHSTVASLLGVHKEMVL